MAELKHPLIVEFTSGNGKVQTHNDKVYIPVYSYKQDTMDTLNSALTNTNAPYDFIAVNYKNIKHETKSDNVLRAANLRTKWLLNIKQNGKILPVINRLSGGKQLYLLNPQYDNNKHAFVAFDGGPTGNRYVASSEAIEAKYKSFPHQAAWEHYQSNILNKFKAEMPLSNEHKKALMAPKRGLHEDELGGFFDWRSNEPIVPDLMNDNMIGIPSVKASSFDNINVSAEGIPMGTGSLLALKTGGKSGIMIPMTNPQGDTPKYQVAADVSKINCILKAKADDGVSIQKSEYYDKHTGIYNFKLDGKASNLKLTKANEEELTFADIKGDFNLHMGDDVKDTLINRGYEIPKIINTLTPTKETKYIWMARGDMIGPNIKKFNNISPSNPGFIEAKKPENGHDDYVVLVAEGALKGVITAKYINHPDKNGHSLGNKIAGDRGIIVAQVPGVAKQFVKGVPAVYKGKNIAGTYIAMDADGRENRNVAQGIKSAYEELSQYGAVKVMSWDPKQKGIDDSLLAIANGKITLEEMDVHFGTPEKLFPIDKAKVPIPYKLNGQRAYESEDIPEWKREYQNEVNQANADHVDAEKNDNKQIDLNFKGIKHKQIER